MLDLLTAAKLFSDPKRVRILAVLRHGELCVCELCDALELRQSTLSTHLQLLRQSGFVCTRQEGKWIYYGVAPEVRRQVEAFFALFEDTLTADKRLRRDADRVRQRLTLRTDGLCLLGFDQLGEEVKPK